MEDLLYWVVGLLIAILVFIFKNVWSRIKVLEDDSNKSKVDCGTCKAKLMSDSREEISKLLESISYMIDEKLESWWAKIENSLMNEGRLAPKKKKSQES